MLLVFIDMILVIFRLTRGAYLNLLMTYFFTKDKQTKREKATGGIHKFSLGTQNSGSGALPGKMLLVRIIENNKIEAYFRSG